MPRVMIVAGESSGDLHGGNLLRAAARIGPQLKFFGVGGQRMKEAGCEIVFPSEELSVMGLVEVVCQFPRILARFRQLKKILTGGDQPDALVLIDFPDFNLRLAKIAKQQGIPVLYYICPKVWAWRSGRAKTIAERADRLALIFPFEPEIFRPYGVRAEYVGNPLLDEYHQPDDRTIILKKHGMDPARPVVGLFPGSRKNELRYNLPTLIRTAELMRQKNPELQFLLPLAPGLDRKDYSEILNENDRTIFPLRDDIYDLAGACQAVLAVSGTVTLQVALTGTPFAIIYKASPASFAIAKTLVKLTHVGLPNIVAGREIVREILQKQATPETLAGEMFKILEDQTYSTQIESDLIELKKKLGQPGTADRVASMIQDMVGS